MSTPARSLQQNLWLIATLRRRGCLATHLHTLCVASRFVARRQPEVLVKAPAAMPELADHSAAVAWLDAEQLNLHSAADYAAVSNRPIYTIAISGVLHGYLCSYGHWDQALALHKTALDAVQRTGNTAAGPRALTGLRDHPATHGQRLFGCHQLLDLCHSGTQEIEDRPGAAAGAQRTRCHAIRDR